MFKREIYRVGEKLPFIHFAIYNDPAPTGNFEVFRKILVKPDVFDPN